jgi:hypothetical protein
MEKNDIIEGLIDIKNFFMVWGTALFIAPSFFGMTKIIGLLMLVFGIILYVVKKFKN